MAPPKKLDKGMALAIMGFANARPLELVMSKPDECREMLDKALYKRTQDILQNPNGLELPVPGGGRRKSGTAATLNISNDNGSRRSMKRRKSTSAGMSPARGSSGQEEKPALSFGFKMDDMSMAEKNNILHEAYQFLVKRYIPKDQRKKKSSTTKPKTIEKSETTTEEVETNVDEVVIDSSLDFSHLST